MTSTPPHGQGWAAIRSRIASTPAIVTTSSDMSRRRATTQRKACAMPTSVPAVLAAWLQPFAASFTNAVWRHVLVLVAGVVLAPGRRTITAALRVMGLDHGAGFAVYYRVLSLGRWSSRAVAHRLLLLLVAALVPQGPVVIGLDDTIERRWGGQDQGARDLPRPGPLQPWPLRQSQRPALALRDAAGSDPVGRLRLGPARPDRARTLRAVEPPTPAAAQEADRLGPAGAAP